MVAFGVSDPGGGVQWGLCAAVCVCERETLGGISSLARPPPPIGQKVLIDFSLDSSAGSRSRVC